MQVDGLNRFFDCSGQCYVVNNVLSALIRLFLLLGW